MPGLIREFLKRHLLKDWNELREKYLQICMNRSLECVTTCYFLLVECIFLGVTRFNLYLISCSNSLQFDCLIIQYLIISKQLEGSGTGPALPFMQFALIVPL